MLVAHFRTHMRCRGAGDAATVLRRSSNKIGYGGAVALAGALHGLTALRQVDLS
jgi:hypothetical protein